MHQRPVSPAVREPVRHSAFSEFPHCQQVALCSGGLLLPCQPSVSSIKPFLGAATVLRAWLNLVHSSL